jgi:hypothetical protein
MKRSMVLMSLAALMLAGTASAAMKQGDVEAQALATYLHATGANGGGDVDVFAGMGGVNYMATPNIQVGGMLLAANLKPKDSDATTLWALGIRGAYFFMPEKQIPVYAGAQIGTGQAKLGGSSSNGTIYGGFVGIRYELTPITDLFVEGQYNATSGDLNDAVDSIYGVFAGLAMKVK